MDQNSTKKMLILQLMDPREEELLGDRTKENPRTKKKVSSIQNNKAKSFVCFDKCFELLSQPVSL